MSDFSRTLRIARRIALGMALMVTMSLAAAAVVILLPDTPLRAEGSVAEETRSMNDYVLRHRGRNAVVPNYMRVDVDPSIH